jgi:predicted Zn-dependent protease
MHSYNATYTISGTMQPATVVLLNGKAAIQLYTPEGARTVYWFYHEMARDAANGSFFTYMAYPPQTLEVLDNATADALATRLTHGKKAVAKKRNRTAVTLFASCVLFIAALYFFLLPWMATALARRVPVTYEKELGEKVFQAMKQDFNIDEARSAYATAFFDALRISSRYDIKITVVKSDVANAFAIPGGHIVIYDKLLNGLSSYPQLAALLAHEFVHIENRHSLKSLFRQASATLLLSALIGDAGALGGAVLNSAHNLKSLSYSRSLESEADADGLALLTNRNIDAAGFVQLFQILQKEPATQSPEWTSSHPDLNKRIRNIEQNEMYKKGHAVTDSTLYYLFLKMKTAD